MSTDIVTDIKTIGSLKKRADFLRVNALQKKWVTKSFIIQYAPQPEGLDIADDIRFGLTITKRVYKNATDRNRVKRRLRAICKDILPTHGIHTSDYVLIGRAEARDKDFEDIRRDLKWALKRLHSAPKT